MVPKQTQEEIQEEARIQEEINEEIGEDIKEEATDDDIDIQEELNDLEPGAIPQQEETHNTLNTSLSRDGFIISTSVTQRRLKEKKSQSELADFLKNKK